VRRGRGRGMAAARNPSLLRLATHEGKRKIRLGRRKMFWLFLVAYLSAVTKREYDEDDQTFDVLLLGRIRNNFLLFKYFKFLNLNI
jgi:hypothetical protein